MRFGLWVCLFLSGCGFLSSGFTEYCEDYVDCMDGNDEDARACQVQIDSDRKVARAYDCESDYSDYMDCMKEDADCESSGGYDYWTDQGECADDYEDYIDCLEDESDILGGSGNDGGFDTGYSY